jgi:CheY-like chemotaxis protein
MDTEHLRVLVVDDDTDAAELTCELLQSLGHEVKSANDAEHALELLETFDAQVAILDLTLPGMSGYELAARIRARKASASTRLIALSGYGHTLDRARTEQAGFSLRLSKPVPLDVLAQSVFASVKPAA